MLLNWLGRMASDSDDSRDGDYSPLPSSSSQSGSGSQSRRTRGPNKNIAWSNLPLGTKLDVELDGLNLPVGYSGSQYTRYLGTLARDTSLCPFHHTGWHQLPNEKKELIWSKVQKRCNVPNGLKGWSIKEVGDRWNAYKHRLKRDHYNTSSSAAACMTKKPKKIPLDQWQSLDRTDKAKVARSKLKTKHTMGSIGYAAHKHKIMQNTGKAPTKVELWKHCHTKKDGTPVDPESARMMAEMDGRSQPLDSSQTSSPSVISPDEVFSKVMGPERPGRLRCMGKGITKTVLQGSCSKAASSMKDEQVRQLIREEMSNMQKSIDKQMEQQFAFQHTIFQQQLSFQQTMFQHQIEATFERLIAVFQGSVSGKDAETSTSKARRNPPAPPHRHPES